MSARLKALLKDALLVSAVFATISGTYIGFAYAERYRALTAAYIAQSQEIIRILQQNAPVNNGNQSP
jgi:hypothetical protein